MIKDSLFRRTRTRNLARIKRRLAQERELEEMGEKMLEQPLESNHLGFYDN